MEEIEHQKLLQESENKIVNAYLSLIQNVKSHGTFCVDFADLYGTTWKKDMLFLMLEKSSFHTLEDLKRLVDKIKFRGDIKTIWIEVRISKKHGDDFGEIINTAADAVLENFENKDNVVLTDCWHETPDENYISILGFG